MAGHRKFDTLRHKADQAPIADQVRRDLRDRDDRTVTTLAELRARCGVRQVELAERLDRSQPQVSRIENSRDPLVSTLAAYVDALGGQLELTVRLEGLNEPLILDLPALSEALMPASDTSTAPPDLMVALEQALADRRHDETAETCTSDAGDIQLRRD